MQRLVAKNPPDRPLLSAETGNVEIGHKIPAETASFRSTTVSAVREDWMVVCTVRYEPVSLLFGQYQGDFRKKQRADYEKSQKCPQTCGFSLSRQIREQGETGSIDRRKQGNEFADSGSKKFRAAKCAAHGLGWFDSEADV